MLRNGCGCNQTGIKKTLEQFYHLKFHHPQSGLIHRLENSHQTTLKILITT